MSRLASCHCGAVRLRFPTLDLASARCCDGSMCRRKGAIMVGVPRADLVVEAGGTLRRYRFGTATAEHWFCGTCGIYRAIDAARTPMNTASISAAPRA